MGDGNKGSHGPQARKRIVPMGDRIFSAAAKLRSFGHRGLRARTRGSCSYNFSVHLVLGRAANCSTFTKERRLGHLLLLINHESFPIPIPLFWISNLTPLRLHVMGLVPIFPSCPENHWRPTTEYGRCELCLCAEQGLTFAVESRKRGWPV